MPYFRFDTIWAPRVGQDAADLLKKRAWFGYVGFGILFLIVLLGSTATAATYFWIVGVALAVYLVLFAWLVPHMTRDVAAATAQHLGLPITVRNLPSFRSPEQFDRVIDDIREGRPRRWSYFHSFARTAHPSAKQSDD